MKKLIVIFGTVAGSWLGWWLGMHIGLMTAFVLSMIGTGIAGIITNIPDKILPLADK